MKTTVSEGERSKFSGKMTPIRHHDSMEIKSSNFKDFSMTADDFNSQPI